MVLIEVSDSAGNRVRRLTGPSGSGIHRVTWDLQYQPMNPVNGPPFQVDPDFPFFSAPAGPFVLPGRYTARWDRTIDGARAGAGLYFVRMISPAGQMTGRVMITN